MGLFPTPQRGRTASSSCAHRRHQWLAGVWLTDIGRCPARCRRSSNDRHQIKTSPTATGARFPIALIDFVVHRALVVSICCVRGRCFRRNIPLLNIISLSLAESSSSSSFLEASRVDSTREKQHLSTIHRTTRVWGSRTVSTKIKATCERLVSNSRCYDQLSYRMNNDCIDDFDQRAPVERLAISTT